MLDINKISGAAPSSWQCVGRFEDCLRSMDRPRHQRLDPVAVSANSQDLSFSSKLHERPFLNSLLALAELVLRGPIGHLT